MDTRRRDILNSYAARTNMSAREYEILEGLIARANPPPLLYRYRRANDFTLSELTKREIFAATPDDMNDPFEYYAPVSFDHAAFRRQFIDEFAPTRGISQEQAAKEFDAISPERLSTTLLAGMESIRKDSGIICLSAVPNSIRMWSYYADAHKGICIGFDTEAGPFLAAMKVTYQNPEHPLDVAAALREDPTQLAGHISLRKAAEWDFEQEYRIPVGPIGDRPRAMPYHPSAILEVRFGARTSEEFKRKVMQSTSDLPQQPKFIQMRCDYERFVLTEEEVQL